MASATSRSLPDVPDVLYHVFSYLDPVHQLDDDAVYESRRSLAIAARTCQGFTGPALDVLWKRLPDDQPLADLLCALEISEREKHQDNLGRNKAGRYRLPNQDEGGYRILGAAEAYEERWRLSRGYDIKYFMRNVDDPRIHPGWPRFVEYASRVRTITLFAFDCPAWCDIWEELQSRTEGAPILPKLLSVAFCHISTRALTPGALALISPSIEKLRLEVPPSVLGPPLLQMHCAHVRYLKVFPQLDIEELLLLTALPALQFLSISLSSTVSVPRATPALPFESVTTLVVEGTWANLSSLLDTTLLPSMHTLSVTGWDYGEPAAELAKAATQCLRTISARHATISSLSMSAAPGRVPPSSGWIPFGMKVVTDAFEGHLLDLVRPLLSLSALRNLSLGFPTYFDIACTAADLRAVAESFRALESFHLRIWPYFGFAIRGNSVAARERPRGGPLEALAHFARGCPRLRLLHLPAMSVTGEAPAMPVVDDEPTHEPHHALRSLVIPRVLLPAGGTDLAGRVSELVGAAFPLVASAFRPERLVMEGDWAVADGASPCPGCARGSKLTFS
ncbi:hypothetical protein LXA43DRAFT_1165746 [Ganoderma leucocontextum]|nr:hypothetical protein LXA43DRAFT_1165746 [Ganoderma leucocontextum]